MLRMLSPPRDTKSMTQCVNYQQVAIEKGITLNLDPYGMEEFKYIYVYNFQQNSCLCPYSIIQATMSTHLLILYIFGAKF
jgi:hypothetical protein